MKTKIKNVFKKMLDGWAHHHHGAEFLTTEKKIKYLEDTKIDRSLFKEAKPVLKQKVKKDYRKHVAMYMGSSLPDYMMNYVMHSCENLNQDLTILTFESPSVSSNLLDPYREELERRGINLRVSKMYGPPVEALSQYLRRHPEVTFLALKEKGYLGRTYVYGKIKKKLAVPVVIVVSNE